MSFAVLCRLAAAATLGTGVALAAPAGAVTQYTYSFLACDFVTNCPNPTQIAALRLINGPLAAPALGPNNPYGYFTSVPQPVPAYQVLAGLWDQIYLISYRNVFGQTGSAFIFDNLDSANGQDYGATVLIDAYVAGPSRNPMMWNPGVYTGLIAASCNYGIACPSNGGAVESVRVVVTAEEGGLPGVPGTPLETIRQYGADVPETGATPVPGAMPASDVPEPATAALLAAMLAGMATVRRRGGRV